MTDQIPTTDLPFDLESTIEENRLELIYRNSRGNCVVRRIITNHGNEVSLRSQEWMYNHDGRWQSTHDHQHSFMLKSDGETLTTKDGEEYWSGEGYNWIEWFVKRHVDLLPIRFRYDKDQTPTIEEVVNEATSCEQVSIEGTAPDTTNVSLPNRCESRS